MEVLLAGGVLPLLLLAWLPAGLAHRISARIDVSAGLDLILQCLLQTGWNSTARKVEWISNVQNSGEKLNQAGEGIKKDHAQLVLTSVNEAHAGLYACGMENTWKMLARIKQNNHGTISQPAESVIPVGCSFKIWSEDVTVHVMWYELAGPEVGNRTNAMALGEDCANLTSPGVRAASTGICGCRVFVRRINSPGFLPGALQTNGTKKETWTRFNFLLCITFGLAIGTFLYMPIIVFLLWWCGRSRKGKITSRRVAEENQLSMAALGTETEDLTYANLKFEKKGPKPTSSDIIYTEINPSQQRPSGEGAGAASMGSMSPSGERANEGAGRDG